MFKQRLGNKASKVLDRRTGKDVNTKLSLFSVVKCIPLMTFEIPFVFLEKLIFRIRLALSPFYLNNL